MSTDRRAAAVNGDRANGNTTFHRAAGGPMTSSAQEPADFRPELGWELAA
jgi:hypothetical protein